MDKSKKIVFFDHDAAISGSTVSMKYIVEAYVKQNYKVSVLTRKDENGVNYLKVSGAEIIKYSNNPFKSIALSVHFADEATVFSKKGLFNIVKDTIRFVNGIITSFKVIYKFRPDLIYINEYNMIHCALIAKLFDIKVCCHIRSTFIHGTVGLRRTLLRCLLLLLCDRIFAITKMEANQISTKSDKIFIIPEFLDNDDFIDSCPANENVTENYDGRKVILMLGGVDILKGSLTFLKAAKAILSNRNDVMFLLAGVIKKDGKIGSNKKYYSTFMDILRDEIFKNNFILLGHVKNVSALIRNASILVSPFSYSHFSRPVIEAWGMKVPVIASDTQHSKELIDNLNDGLLFKVDDPKNLAEKVNLLLDNSSLSQKLCNNGFKKAKQYYFKSNIDIIVKETKKILNT